MNVFFSDTTLVANDVDKLNSEEAEDNYLKTDMSGIIKLFCQVDKTTNNYVRECSFFKRKRVQSKYSFNCFTFAAVT